MKKVAKSQKLTFVNIKNEKVSPVVGLIDWLELRIVGIINLDYLAFLGYNSSDDKGCSTHNHYFENDIWSLSWDIKASYIDDKFVHFRLKNRVFYSESFLRSDITQFVSMILKPIFHVVQDVFVSRIDFCFDMLENSNSHKFIKRLFKNENIDEKIKRYGTIGGCFDGKDYVNYYAGNRGGQKFYRLYNKTIENTDYHTKTPKKPYITELHESVFGGRGNIQRFEIEYKPVRLDFLTFDVQAYQDKLYSKFFVSNPKIDTLGLPYVPSETFTKRDALMCSKLIEKYASVYLIDTSKSSLSAFLHNLNKLM